MDSTSAPDGLMESALVYVRMGLPVLPLHTMTLLLDRASSEENPHYYPGCDCPESYKLLGKCKPAKHPIHDLVPHGLLQATLSEAIVKAWWEAYPEANLAVALGPAGLIDIAPDSVEWWAEFKARGLPSTMHFASGGGEGHEHWLYRRGDLPRVRIARSGRFDIMSDGYAVMPPSRHASGNPYRWIEWVDLADRPSWADQVVLDHVEARSASDDEVIAADTSEPPVELDNAQRAVWEGDDQAVDRSNRLVEIARMLADVGYTDTEGIASILAERDETTGWQKYSKRRDASRRYREIAERYGKSSLQAHVSGTRSAVPPIGVGTGERVSDSKATPSGSRGLIRWRNHAETMAMRPPLVDWLIEGVLGRGLITELVAKVKMGKTTFMLGGLRAGIAGDDEYCGREVHGPFRVGYVTEEGESTFLEAMRRYGLNDLVAQDAFFTVFDYETLEAPLSKMVDELIEHATADRVDVVILDTLSIIANLDEEDHAGKAAAAMHEVRRLAAAGFAVGILRHSRKSGGDVGDAGRGSSAISGYCDVLLQIEPFKGDEDSTNLRVLKSRSRLSVTEPLIMEFDAATERYRWVGAVQTREERLSEKILEALGKHPAARDRGSAVTANEITLRAGKRRQDIRAELPSMVARGAIKSDKHKPDRGPEVDVYWSPLIVNLGGKEPVPGDAERAERAERVSESSTPLTGSAVDPVSGPLPVPEKTPPEVVGRNGNGSPKKAPTPEAVAKRAEEKAQRDLARLEAADAAAPTLKYYTVLTESELMRLDMLKLQAVSLDTETTGLSAHHDRLRTINLSDGEKHLVIDTWSVLATAESEFPWKPLQRYLDEVLEVRMHTYLFDLAFLASIGVSIDPAKIADVKTLSMVMESQEDWTDYRLQGIAKRHLAEHVDKTEQKRGWDAPVLHHAKLAYAAEDARVTFAVEDALKAKLRTDPDADGLSSCLSLEQNVQAATWWLASAGAPCDVNVLRDAIADQAALIDDRLQELNAVAEVSVSVNWKSPSQVLPILQARGLDIVSTSVDALMEAQSDDRIIDALLKYRSAQTCVGLLRRTLEAVASDGRIYASYNPIGAQTGRTSCSEPNLQQLPHETQARAAFRPLPGRAFVRADYSQLQIVIAAWLSGDKNMQRIINSPGGDVHQATADAAGCSREQAKAINFGFLFGAGSDTFRREQRKNGIVLTEDQAKTYRNTFMKQYAGIKRWHRNLGEWGTEAEVIDDTGSGRRRSHIFSNNVKANTPVQMAEAHGMKLAMTALYNDRAAVPSARLIMMVHDELIAECDYDERYAVAAWLKTHMVNAMQPLVDGVKVDVEVKLVASYSDDDKKYGEKV